MESLNLWFSEHGGAITICLITVLFFLTVDFTVHLVLRRLQSSKATLLALNFSLGISMWLISTGLQFSYCNWALEHSEMTSAPAALEFFIRLGIAAFFIFVTPILLWGFSQMTMRMQFLHFFLREPVVSIAIKGEEKADTEVIQN